MINPNLLKSPISRTALLAGACFLAIAPFFLCGNPSGHDFEFHTFSWMEVLNQWKHGILYPRWAALAHWGYGEARFLFYPPASWTLGAALGAVLPWKTVPGAYCFLALLLAAASMYLLAREWFSPPDALFAAAFYALNPYHLLIVYWRSAYAELLAAALLPLLLLSLLRLTKVAGNAPGVRPTLTLSLILAAAWLTNEPAAIMIHYSAAALVLFLVLTATKPAAARTAVRIVLRTAAAILLGAGLAAFYLLPAIYEQSWVNLGEVLSPGVRPQDNFLFTTIADPDHNRFNLFVSTMALAEILALILAICFTRKRQEKLRRAWIILSSWGALTVLLMLKATHWFWQHLPELRFVQLPFRWLLSMNAALAILLVMATKRWSVRFATFAILLSVLLISGHHFQPPWWEKAADFHDMSHAIADGSGYEGTDEYVPAGDDPSELNKTLPPISNDSTSDDSISNNSASADSGAPIPFKIQAWEPTEKHFTVHAAAKQNIIVRLFSYPAFEVTVNGKPTVTSKTDDTGLIVIPVDAGDNDIHIHFRVTKDRLLGDIISLISLAALVIAWFCGTWFVRTWFGGARKKSAIA